MFQQLKFNIFHTRWHILRILQLVLSVIVFIQAITDKHYVLLIPSFVLVYMAVMNTCSSCSIGWLNKSNYTTSIKSEDIQYKEITEKK